MAVNRKITHTNEGYIDGTLHQAIFFYSAEAKQMQWALDLRTQLVSEGWS
jgi:hypothetical protein